MVRLDINVIFVVETRVLHQTGHLAFVCVQFFVIVVHGDFGLLAQVLGEIEMIS